MPNESTFRSSRGRSEHQRDRVDAQHEQEAERERERKPQRRHDRREHRVEDRDHGGDHERAPEAELDVRDDGRCDHRATAPTNHETRTAKGLSRGTSGVQVGRSP